MDKKLTREEVARVFAMYIGCTIAHDENQTAQLIGIINTDAHFIHNGSGSYGHQQCEECGKLLLTPIDKITDEDKVLLYHQYSGLIAKYDYTQDYKGVLHAANHWFNTSGKQDISKYSCLTDIARALGYDTPIYFRANHWANGMDAIHLNLAIQKQ